MQIEISEEQRQMVLLALGHLAVERPGWDHPLNEIACKMDNVEAGRATLYDNFRKLQTPTKAGSPMLDTGYGRVAKAPG